MKFNHYYLLILLSHGWGLFYTTDGHTSAILTYESPFINDNLATLLKFFLIAVSAADLSAHNYDVITVMSHSHSSSPSAAIRTSRDFPRYYKWKRRSAVCAVPLV